MSSQCNHILNLITAERLDSRFSGLDPWNLDCAFLVMQFLLLPFVSHIAEIFCSHWCWLWQLQKQVNQAKLLEQHQPRKVTRVGWEIHYNPSSTGIYRLPIDCALLHRLGAHFPEKCKYRMRTSALLEYRKFIQSKIELI